MTSGAAVEPVAPQCPRPGTRPPEVVHLLLEGDVDGIGLHVLDLAAAQLAGGTVRPQLVTRASPPYAHRLAAAGVPVTPLPDARLPAVLAAAAAGSLLPVCDVLHLHGRRAAQLALAAAAAPVRAPARHLLGGHAVVATCHGWLGGSPRRRLRRASELRSYGVLDLLITTSREQAAVVAGRRGRRPVVAYVPNGVPEREPPDGDAALARLGLPARAAVVGNVGRLAPEKRQDVLLRACARVRARRPDVHVVLLGTGPERDRLERLAARLGMADHVRFVGLVDDVAATCAAFSLLMHTSDTEGTPRAVVEAMMAGVPVVATAVGGVPDLVRHGVTGLLAPRRDPDALAGAALALLADPGLATAMGEAGRVRAQTRFTARAMARRVEELYRVHAGPSTPGAA